MAFYPPKINERFHSSRNAGRDDGKANTTGMSATFICGTVLRFSLQINQTTGEIEQIKFQTNGCGYALAAADVLAEKVKGKALTELHGLKNGFLQQEIEKELDVFEPPRKHCLDLALDALHQAFANYRKRQIEEYTGEKALICTCFGVSEETIERIVEKESAEIIEDVTAICGAGGGCGSCQPLIQEIIDIYWREQI